MIIAYRKKYAKWPIEPKYYGMSRKHSWQYYYEIGFDRYKLGYDPIHIFFHLRHGINYIFYLIGYFTALVKKVKKYPFANEILYIKIKEIPIQIKKLNFIYMSEKSRNFNKIN